MFKSFFSKVANKYVWEPMGNHQTWKIQNHPINIDDEYILYSTDFTAGEKGIVFYYVQSNKFVIFKYPHHIKPEGHSYCRSNNTIYMFNADGIIFTFDLSTKQYDTITQIKQKRRIGAYSACFSLGDGAIHIIGGLQNRHYLKYDIAQNVMHKLQDFGAFLQHPCIVKYLEQNKVFMFSGYCTDIMFVGDISNNDTHDIVWQKSAHLKIPKRVKDCGTILFDGKLILFGGNTGYDQVYSDAIYVLDVESSLRDSHSESDSKHNEDAGTYSKLLGSVRCPFAGNFHAVLSDHKLHLFGLSQTIQHYAATIENIIETRTDRSRRNIHSQLQPGAQQPQPRKSNSADNSQNSHTSALQQQMQQLAMENETLRQEMEEMKMENTQLKLDKVDLSAENTELKRTVSQLQQQLIEQNAGSDQQFDLLNYKDWGTKTVVLWILSLENGMFTPYKAALSAALSDQAVDGDDLVHINNHKYWKTNCHLPYNLRGILINRIHDLGGMGADNEGRPTAYADE